MGRDLSLSLHKIRCESLMSSFIHILKHIYQNRTPRPQSAKKLHFLIFYYCFFFFFFLLGFYSGFELFFFKKKTKHLRCFFGEFWVSRFKKLGASTLCHPLYTCRSIYTKIGPSGHNRPKTDFLSFFAKICLTWPILAGEWVFIKKSFIYRLNPNLGPLVHTKSIFLEKSRGGEGVENLCQKNLIFFHLRCAWCVHINFFETKIM